MLWRRRFRQLVIFLTAAAAAVAAAPCVRCSVTLFGPPPAISNNKGGGSWRSQKPTRLADSDDPVQILPNYQCYNGSNKYGWEHYGAYVSSKRAIAIEVDEWDSATLASRILEFALTDVMGYNVALLDYPGGTMSGDLLAKGEKVDVAMELWVSDAGIWYEKHVREERSVIDLGGIGYTGRIGLYVPTWITDARPELALDFWRFLHNAEALSLFPQAVTTALEMDSAGNYICDAVPNGCQQGVYLPTFFSENSSFVQIWYSWAEYSPYVYERTIEGLKLNATIQYLGNVERDYVDRALKDGTPVIFYSWKPSTFVASRNVSRIMFPDDKDSGFLKFSRDKQNNLLTVDIPSEVLFKASSANFQREYPEATTLVSNININDEDINSMLRQVEVNGAEHAEAACNWFLANEQIWKGWIPSPPKTYTTCPAGTGLYQMEGLSVCLNCEAGFYNYKENTTEGCNICPDQAICPGGAVVNVKSGIWRSAIVNTTVPDFYPCPYDSCCPSGNCTVDHICEEGFAGILCAQCADPEHYLWNQKCHSCEKPGTSLYLMIGGSLLATIGVVFIPRKEVPTIELLFFYFQVINLILGASLEEILGSKGLHTFLEVASLNADGLVFDCPAPLKGVQRQMFRFFLPAIFFFHLGLLYFVLLLVRVFVTQANEKIANLLPGHMRQQSLEVLLFRASKTIFTFTLMPFIEASLALLDCRHIEQTSVLFYVPTEVCFSNEHVGPGAFAILVLFLFLGVAPLSMSIVLFRLWREKKIDVDEDCDSNEQAVLPQLHKSLYENFRGDYFFMEPIFIWEKGLVVMIFSFFGNQAEMSQTIAFIVLFSALCLARVYIQPFNEVIEAYLNREICLGWLIVLVIRYAMSQTKVVLAPLVAIVMFLPAALHVGRWINFKALDYTHFPVSQEEDLEPNAEEANDRFAECQFLKGSTASVPTIILASGELAVVSDSQMDFSPRRDLSRKLSRAPSKLKARRSIERLNVRDDSN
ncbi:hypothetical protein DFJ73DRAFT_469429 [Zopfochytrium polystomum]|nr:hypothetical protein DFJ73DRAFT_469429 [Zopfochytrium polystomum]